MRLSACEVIDGNVSITFKAAWQLGINPFRILREMHSLGNGMSQFYSGFESHLIGRLGYLAIRNTIYKVLYDMNRPEKPTNDLTNNEKIIISSFAGGVAAWAMTPFAVINIRTILDSQIKPEWRRNYGGANSGLAALGENKFKGAWANVVRHVMINATLTAPFDYYKEWLYLRFGDYGFVKPLAIFASAATSAFLTLPFDNARTRLMQAHSHPERNRMNYTGIIDVFCKSALHEKSHWALWTGYYTYFLSTWVYAVLTIGITSTVTDTIKRSKGISEWNI